MPLADTDVPWSELRRRLRAFVARRIANRADADDVVQRVFLQLHRSLADIRSGETVRAWLYTTARRAIADHHRAGARRREVASGDALDLERLEASAAPRPDDGARAEVASCLAPVVERLDRNDREAITLIEIHGLRLADAAARSGLSLPGMKSRVQRARRRLRTAVLACCRLTLDGQGMPIACARRAPALVHPHLLRMETER
ncbi:MAG: sigma-70 family RNA polymerase sigma factor [Vicinamibacteria bacterium]